MHLYRYVCEAKNRKQRLVRHIRVTRRHPSGGKVLFCVLAAGGGKFFTRPYIPRPPRLYIRWVEGGSRPQKGQNTVYSGRPLYVGQCRESPRLLVTKYAQWIWSTRLWRNYNSTKQKYERNFYDFQNYRFNFKIDAGQTPSLYLHINNYQGS